jgi:sarcosine oxidase subunit alpha
MMQDFRTSSGGRIDRSSPLRFVFDGRHYTGFAGDTLASALLANGVHLMGRSFKYHRPRGVVAAGAEEPNALVQIGTGARAVPNLRATQVELYEGLVAESQNRFPSLERDIGGLNDLAAAFFPAGFYYKTFMWPAWGWKKLYEPFIRRAAGLGRAPEAPDPDFYAQRYVHCDVLVVGGGPAGLAAALAASKAGGRVVLCDEQAEFGGSLLDAADEADEDWRAATLAALGRSPRVKLLSRTTAFGVFAQNFVGLAERVTAHLAQPGTAAPRERLWQVRARQIVLATGAIERPLVFSGNDRPGIMLAGSARTYLNRYGVRPGTRAVLVTSNDEAYDVARDFARAGIVVAAIADLRTEASAAAVAAREEKFDVRLGVSVAGTAGRLRVRSATLQQDGRQETIACDLLLMSGGRTPTVHLFSQAAGKLRYEAGLGAYVPEGDTDSLASAGACRGVAGAKAALEDGERAGVQAARRAQGTAPARKAKRIAPLFGAPATLAAPAQGKGRAFVDFQNDVTSKDVAQALREGFVSVEHVKRYTTCGMATDQGKTSNINALTLMSEGLHSEVPAIGLTTYRMPYTPVTFGTLAGAARGALFDPVRETPLNGWAQAQGAVFEDVSLWKRARYFPQGRETMHQAVARECQAVRSHAGIFDASTLGKIEVVGPDAAVFLERMYVNGFRKLGVGRARYGLLLREDGFVLDDGVIGRISETRFHVTTTTGGAPRVLAMMEDYLQTEFSDLSVWLTSTTEEWAVIALQGPRARDILDGLVEGIDLSPAAMPHMSVREGRVCGSKVRLFRVSFTGELGFELNVPADHAQAVWDAVWAKGAAFGLVPYGTETMHVLRAEKGYIIVGQETDGTVTPDDVGLSWAIGQAKRDFVGKRSLARPAMQAADRKQLVGLEMVSSSSVLEEGAQIVNGAGPKSLGHVTSAYYSAALGRPIALAMVAGGRARMGEVLRVPMPGGDLAVRVVNPVFYDSEGARLNA